MVDLNQEERLPVRAALIVKGTTSGFLCRRLPPPYLLIIMIFIYIYICMYVCITSSSWPSTGWRARGALEERWRRKSRNRPWRGVRGAPTAKCSSDPGSETSAARRTARERETCSNEVCLFPCLKSIQEAEHGGDHSDLRSFYSLYSARLRQNTELFKCVFKVNPSVSLF